MSFLKKLLGGNKKPVDSQEKKDPENTRLNFLLNIWGENHSNENFKAVMEEILNGNSFLILPSANDEPGSGNWETAQQRKTLNLTSVYNLDGLKVLGAFSDEKSLLEWTQYTALKTQDMIDFCKENNIDRIVINSDQKNMFVLERNRENIKTTTIEKETKVLIGTPIKPLSKRLIDKLIANFKKVDTIEEAYQYAQNMNDESSIVLGIKMSVVSDNSRAALHNALNNALTNEKIDMPIDVMILDTQDWLETVRNIQNSLFYKQ
jgi:hypothetical protein